MELLPFKPQVRRERKGTYVRTVSSGQESITIPGFVEDYNQQKGPNVSSQKGCLVKTSES